MHAEYGGAGTDVIAKLECSIHGTELALDTAPGSLLAQLHTDDASVTESATCFYGLNPSLESIASTGGMRVAARDGLGEIRAVERVDHPFFLATLYQPQLRTSAGNPHPVFTGLLRAAQSR